MHNVLSAILVLALSGFATAQTGATAPKSTTAKACNGEASDREARRDHARPQATHSGHLPDDRRRHQLHALS